MNLEVKRRIGRMDWADGGERNGGEGYGGRKETGGVGARIAWKRNGQI